MAIASKTSPRPPRPTIDAEVVRVTEVNPHLVRVTLGGAGLAQFQDRPDTDKYVKLRFTDADGDPVTRTYTVRSVNSDKTIDIDFVVHGDEGLAGPWASRAQPGDAVSFFGPGGGYQPNPDAQWYLYLGDLSAVPAIAASLEALPSDAAGTAIIEVDSDDAIVKLTAPSGVEVRWVVDASHDVGRLAAEVRALTWRDGHVDVFAHGERESMKLLRRALLDERGLNRTQVSLSGYWARGRTEDRFQAEKREPIGQIFPAS